MGKFGRITEKIENSIPEFNSMRVVPRGLPYFPDTMMEGTVRFGRRTGNNLSVLNPDNMVSLAADSFLQSLTLQVDRVLNWWEYGCLVSFNGIEMYELRDWDNQTNTLVLTNPLSSNRRTGEKLYLWAVPVPVHAPAAAGSHQITVRSKHPIMNGDVLTFPTSEILSSLVEVEVLLAHTAGTSIDPEYPNIYHLTLKEALPQGMEESSACYLRAYVGYASGDVRVPRVSYGQIGPMVLDYLASPLDSTVKYTEHFAIRAFDGGSTPVIGSGNSYQTISKNYPIADRPLWADAFLFWDVVKGSAGFTLPNKFKFKADAEGKGKIYKKLVPEIPSGKTWEFKVTPSSAGVLRVQLAPYGYQDFVLNANVQQTIQVTTPSGGMVQGIYITLNMANPNSYVEISNWNLKGPVIDTLRYTYVFKVLGAFNFQASSLIVKPYFLGLSDLNVDYDRGSHYNSGAIYL